MSGEWVSLGASDPEDASTTTAKVKPSTAKVKVRLSHPSPFLFSFSLFFATFASTPTPSHAPQVQLKRGYSFIHDNIDEESKAHDKGHDTEGLGLRE